MKSFFDPCVRKIIELIDGQIERVEKELSADVKVSSNDSISTDGLMIFEGRLPSRRLRRISIFEGGDPFLHGAGKRGQRSGT